MNEPSQSFECMNDVVDESYDMVMLFNDCMLPLNDAVCDNVQQVTDVQFDVRKFIADSNVSMHFVDLSVFDESGNSVYLKTLFDSGTQLTILKEELISHLNYEILGEVKLQGFNGNVSSGKIILLNAKLAGHDVCVPLRCVVCQNVSQDCLLSLADYRKLLQSQEICSAGVVPGAVTGDNDSMPISQNFDMSVQHTDEDVTDGNVTNHESLNVKELSNDSNVLSLDDSLCTADLVGNNTSAVSYTHLTLPTIYSV